MFALPWTKDTVPHAVIEVTRDCNLACRACYRQKNAGMRPVADILSDVEIIERHQRVHTISLAGGEPTLHPDLPEIVRAVKSRGHCVSLVTNAVLLDEAMIRNLASAGLDIVMIHIDEGQTRPDLPDTSDIAAVNALRAKTAARVKSHGISAGLCTTLYPESMKNLPELVNLIIGNPDINFLFATHAVAIPKLVEQTTGTDDKSLCCGTANSMVIAEMRERFGLEPYAFIPATTATADGELPCITYSVPVRSGSIPAADYLRMTSNSADRLLIKASRLLAGRYLYYTPNSKTANTIQILFNGIFSGHFFRAVSFLVRSWRMPLRMKRLVFENAPRITPQGTVNCCDFCPNSTVRDGKVVPVCLADHKNELNL